MADILTMDVWASIAAVFTVTSIALSFYEIIGHMCNYTKPYLQRYIIRILLIVPIYSLNAFVAMIYPASGLYFDSSREVYESFVIYSFMKYILNFLQHDTNLQQYIDHKPAPAHLFPFCCLPGCVGGRAFMLRCKHGILQYVVVRPITTLVAFISQEFGFYGEDQYNPLSGYTYPVLLIINNLSQFTAMYSLVIFYTGYKQELKPMSPLAKFLSIKLVVFFSFFQQVLISALIEIDAVEDFLRSIFASSLDGKVLIARKCQEFFICIDMLIAAFGHLFAFSYVPFVEDDDDESYPIVGAQTARRQSLARQSPKRRNLDRQKRQNSCCMALGNLMDFTDETSDMQVYFSSIFGRIRQIFTFSRPLPTVVSSPSLITTASQSNIPSTAEEPLAESSEASTETRTPINGGGRRDKSEYRPL